MTVSDPRKVVISVVDRALAQIILARAIRRAPATPPPRPSPRLYLPSQPSRKA